MLVLGTRVNKLRMLGYVLFFSTSILLLSCKKEKEETPEEEVIKGSVTIVPKAITPGDIVTLTFSTPLSKASYEIMIGDKKTYLARISSYEGVFTVPFLPAGIKTVDLSNVNSNDTEIIIDNYTTISNPDEVKNEFMSQLATAAAAMTNGTEKDFLLMTQQTIAEKYIQLSAEEKRNFAFAIQKLTFEAPITVASLPASKDKGKLTTSGAAPKTLKAVEITNEFVFAREMLGCLATSTLACSSIGAGGILIQMPLATGVEKLIGVALAGVGVKLLSDAHGTAVALFNYKGIAISISDLVGMVSINSAASKTSRGTSVSATPDAAVFKANKNYNLHFNGTYSNISKETSNPFFTSFSTRMVNAMSSYNDMVKIINSIKGFFTGTPALEEKKLQINQQSSSAVADIPFSLLSIENVSDSQISLTRVNDENQFIVKATSNTITTEKAFTYDIVYTYSNFDIKVRKTMNAIFDGTIEPNKVAVIAGNNQTGTSGQRLPNSLQVLVTDDSNQPLENVEVEWKIKNGGGTLTAATSKTNAQGVSSNQWTLGTTNEQEVEVLVKKKDGSLVSGAPVIFKAVTPCSQALAPTIDGISFNCNENNKYGVYVAFTSAGSDLIIGAGSGTCDLQTNCYPSRLLIKDTVDPNGSFSVAGNAYNVKLFSGTPRQGVLEFTFTYTENCIPGKSAEEAFRYYYGRFLWKVQLMNQCNKRSEEVSF